MNNKQMTVGELSLMLRRHDPRNPVEIRLVIGDETYISEPASVVPTKDSKGRIIIQVTNES